MATTPRPAQKEQPHYPADPAFALRPALEACPRCQAVVLVRVWNPEMGWRVLPVPLSPVVGEAHQCREQLGERHE
jgi:hypothetical protein